MRTPSPSSSPRSRSAEYEPPLPFWARSPLAFGSAADVSAFLEQALELAASTATNLGLPTQWQAATDPFFDAERDPRFLLQKLEPVKRELVFEDRLAIGSVNFHRDYFGETFGILVDGEPAFSGCLAFGIERWIYALLAHHGPQPREWSSLEASHA